MLHLHLGDGLSLEKVHRAATALRLRVAAHEIYAEAAQRSQQGDDCWHTKAGTVCLNMGLTCMTEQSSHQPLLW